MKGDITVIAKDIKITEARQSSNSLTEQSQSKSGLSLGVSSPLLSAVQGMEAQADAASNTSSSRMKAMAAVNIALQAKQAAAAAADPTVTVSLSIGSSSSSSSQANTSNTGAASTLKAGGNVNLVATGGGKDSNILVQGSQVKAGNTVNLQADNDISLLASKDLETQTSKSTSASASIGIGYTMGPGGAGFGVTVSASGSKGKSDGTDLAYTNTSIDGQRVNITSGGNTTLAGAVVTANKVKADIGGNLTIESLQNSSNYKSSDVSAGGSATFGFGGSVSANASSAKINSNFQSVGTQSGIRAGDGGFEVNVKGNTDLKGGVISSTQAAVDNQLNSFNGNTAEGLSRLTLTDISNKAEFKATSVSISTSGGGAGSMSDKSASTSAAGITGIAGNKQTRTGEKEAGLVQIFDKDKVKADIQAQVTITTAFGQNASKEIGQYAGDKAKDLKAQADNEADPAKRQALKDEAAQWGEGGIYRVGLHAAVGGLTGGANGAVGAATSQTVIPVLGEQIAQLDIPVDLKKALIQVASLSIGVATGGVNGAVAAHNATTNNYLTSVELKSRAQNDSACKQGDSKACQAVQAQDIASIERNSAVRNGVLVVNKEQANKILADMQTTMGGLADYKTELQTQLEKTSDPQQRASLQNQINLTDNSMKQVANLGKDYHFEQYKQTGDPKHLTAYTQLNTATNGNDLADAMMTSVAAFGTSGKTPGKAAGGKTPGVEVEATQPNTTTPRTSEGTANSATAPKLDKDLSLVAKPDPKVKVDADGRVSYSYGEVDRGQGLNASLDSKGVLRLEVKSPESGPRRDQYGSGSDMFDDMMRNVSKKGDIKQIEGQWSNTPGLTSNYDSYLKNLSQGMSPKDAAANTWTGQQAAKYGYVPDANNIRPDGRGGFVVPFVRK